MYVIRYVARIEWMPSVYIVPSCLIACALNIFCSVLASTLFIRPGSQSLFTTSMSYAIPWLCTCSIGAPTLSLPPSTIAHWLRFFIRSNTHVPHKWYFNRSINDVSVAHWCSVICLAYCQYYIRETYWSNSIPSLPLCAVGGCVRVCVCVCECVCVFLCWRCPSPPSPSMIMIFCNLIRIWLWLWNNKKAVIA